jgi:signal transduction histidine kinase
LAQDKQRRGMDTAVEEHLSQILLVVDRGTEMISQIGALNSSAEQDREVIPLDRLLKDILRMMRAGIPESIELRFEIEADAGTVYASASQIFRAVLNLCSNAYRAMAEAGGVLYIELGVLADSTPEDLGLDDGDYLTLSVRDTGVGMSAEEIESAFDSRYSTKEDQVLRGFGLGVVKTIVEEMDGRVTVTSTPGVGTTFTLYLPVCVRTDTGPMFSRISRQFRKSLGAAQLSKPIGQR